MRRFHLMVLCLPSLVMISGAEDLWSTRSVEASAERVIRLFAPHGIEWPEPPHDLSASSTLEKPASGGKLLTIMRQSPDPAVRLRAIESVEDPAAPETLSALLEGLSDPVPTVRALAAERIDGVDTATLLTRILETLETGDVYRIAGLDRALPQLTSRLGPGFLEVLNNPHETPVRRRVAAAGLGRMVYKPAAETLAAGLGADDTDLARACAQALLLLKDVNATDAWINALAHPDPVICAIAVDALALINTEAAFEILKQVALGTTGAAPGLQGLAVQRLAEWPGHRAIPALVDVMEFNPGFRRMALGLLRARTGKDYGESALEWRAALQ